MQNCKIPTIQQCYDLLVRCHVPAHIVRHCEATAGLAVELAEKIFASGTPVSVDFVHRACLLHDIMRVCDFYEPVHQAFSRPPTEQDLANWRKLCERFSGLTHEGAVYEFLKQDWPELALAKS